jgi:hypothetical protein
LYASSQNSSQSYFWASVTTVIMQSNERRNAISLFLQSRAHPKASMTSACMEDAGPSRNRSWPLTSNRTGLTCTTVARPPRARKGSSAAG